MRDLLDARADIDAPCGVEKLTPVMLAAKEGREEAAHLLLDRGAGMGAKDRHGRGLVYFAAEGGLVSVLRRILDLGADMGDGLSSLCAACEHGREAAAHVLIDSLLDRGALSKKSDTGSSFNDLLEMACVGGVISVIDRALAAGADINMPEPYENMTPLISAIDAGKEAAALHLLDLGASVVLPDGREHECHFGSALHYAAMKGSLPLVRRLVFAGASPALRNRLDRGTPATFACVFGKAEDVVLFLLDHMGADGVGVGVRDSHGRTLLHLAAERGLLSVIRRLVVEAGAPIDMRSFERDEIVDDGDALARNVVMEIDFNPGFTPLSTACLNEKEDAALLLVELGASVVRAGENRRGPLHIASTMGHLQLIRLFVGRGADINETAIVERRGVDGVVRKVAMAPLACACYGGQQEAAMLLLDLGANVLAFELGEGVDPLHVEPSSTEVRNNFAAVKTRIKAMQDEGRQKEKERREKAEEKAEARRREAKEAEKAEKAAAQ